MLYKYGVFNVKNNTASIELEGCPFELGDMSNETQEYIKKQISKGIQSGEIIEINKPLDEEEKEELRLREAEVQAIMENNLFDEDEENILTCEWKQLQKILNRL